MIDPTAPLSTFFEGRGALAIDPSALAHPASSYMRMRVATQGAPAASATAQPSDLGAALAKLRRVAASGTSLAARARRLLAAAEPGSPLPAPRASARAPRPTRPLSPLPRKVPTMPVSSKPKATAAELDRRLAKIERTLGTSKAARPVPRADGPHLPPAEKAELDRRMGMDRPRGCYRDGARFVLGGILPASKAPAPTTPKAPPPPAARRNDPFADTPERREAKAELDRRMGLVATTTGTVRKVGNKIVFGGSHG